MRHPGELNLDRWDSHCSDLPMEKYKLQEYSFCPFGKIPNKCPMAKQIVAILKYLVLEINSNFELRWVESLSRKEYTQPTMKEEEIRLLKVRSMKNNETVDAAWKFEKVKITGLEHGDKSHILIKHRHQQ